MTWLEAHEPCNGQGCEGCRGVGLVAHGHQPDEAAALLAHDDQVMQELDRDAQIAAYHRDAFLRFGFSEHAAENMVMSYYCGWTDGMDFQGRRDDDE